MSAASPLVCRHLLDDAGAAFGVIDLDGVVRDCNESFARLYAHRPAAQTRGQRLTDFMPRAAGEERAQLVGRAVHAGKPLVVRELWHGVLLTAVIRPVPGDLCATLVARPSDVLTGMHAPCEGELVATAHTDLGPLATLSTRELEVLAYIGEGLTNHEIAKRIFRSDKTVEWHRSQLGLKLGVNTRVDLARIAHRAGLSEWVHTLRTSEAPGDAEAEAVASAPDGMKANA